MSAERSFLDRHHFLLRRLHSLTGIVPIGVFLIAHLTTNSSLVWGLIDSRKSEYGHRGVATFQHEVTFIHSIPFLMLIELSLWGAIAFHSVLGVIYATTGRSNTDHYESLANWRYKLQRISGYLGILFIFYHVATLRWGWTFLIPAGTAWTHEYAASTMAAALPGGTSLTGAGLAVSLCYFVGVSLLVFHFANGLWTSAITWGLTVSAPAQRRWGQVCFAVGLGMMVLSWAAIAGFMTLDQSAAKKTEQRMMHSQAEAAPAEPGKQVTQVP